MTTKLPLLAALLATSVALVGAPLTVTTAVHTQPDAKSATVSFLKAGTEPVPAADNLSSPAGWMAIDLPGPFEGYVENKDIAKNLEMIPGAAVHLAPSATSGVLTSITAGDKTEITGLHGKWTQIRLEKKLTGYIQVAGAGTAAATPMASAPVAAAPTGPVTTAGRPAPAMSYGDNAASSLPRMFDGKFVSTRNPLRPRRPYDWALEDSNGRRYAYLDLSRLLLTEQLEKYVDHSVVVFGGARSVPGGKDIVIDVESLQLK